MWGPLSFVSKSRAVHLQKTDLQGITKIFIAVKYNCKRSRKPPKKPISMAIKHKTAIPVQQLSLMEKVVLYFSTI